MTLKAICLSIGIFSVPLLAQEGEKLSFTDTVKIVRDLEGATEVIFIKRAGVFTAPEDGGAMEKLIMSQKTGAPVNIVADEANSKILKVAPGDSEQSGTKPAAGKSKKANGK